jgi:hypothetical protein
VSGRSLAPPEMAAFQTPPVEVRMHQSDERSEVTDYRRVVCPLDSLPARRCHPIIVGLAPVPATHSGRRGPIPSHHAVATVGVGRWRSQPLA